jgi:hypothetical protein
MSLGKTPGLEKNWRQRAWRKVLYDKWEPSKSGTWSRIGCAVPLGGTWGTCSAIAEPKETTDDEGDKDKRSEVCMHDAEEESIVGGSIWVVSISSPTVLSWIKVMDWFSEAVGSGSGWSDCSCTIDRGSIGVVEV